MKCKLKSNIESISGRCGNVLYKTFTKLDGSKETRVYLLPRMENGKYGYERKAPLSKNEQAARIRFQEISAQVSAMSAEEKHRYAQEMHDAKLLFNGKKYATLRGYIMARLYAEIGDSTKPA